MCVMCEAQGLDSVAVIRDHIVSLSVGGQDVESNTQGLCAACHAIKSQGEAQRGR